MKARLGVEAEGAVSARLSCAPEADPRDRVMAGIRAAVVRAVTLPVDHDRAPLGTRQVPRSPRILQSLTIPRMQTLKGQPPGADTRKDGPKLSEIVHD